MEFAEGSWNKSERMFANLSKFSAAPTSRHLAVTFDPLSASFNTYLYFESTDQQVTFLNRSFTILHSSNATDLARPDYQSTLSWNWKNRTRKSQLSIQKTHFQFGVPFTSYIVGLNGVAAVQTLSPGRYSNGSYSIRS